MPARSASDWILLKSPQLARGQSSDQSSGLMVNRRPAIQAGSENENRTWNSLAPYPVLAFNLGESSETCVFLECSRVFRVDLDVTFHDQIAALFELINRDPGRRCETKGARNLDDPTVWFDVVGEVLIHPNRVTWPHVFPGSE